MKQIIRGKKYNTETAKFICEYENTWNRTDFTWYKKELYLKNTGEFFFYIEGGPASPYARMVPGGSCGNSFIKPAYVEDAKEFIEKNGSVELYEELFGEVEE